jgi:hypothetical protein
VGFSRYRCYVVKTLKELVNSEKRERRRERRCKKGREVYGVFDSSRDVSMES